MNRVLVTGATGFIGRGTLAPLATSGAEIHALSSRSVPPAGSTEVRWHRVDLLAGSELEQVLERVQPSHLLHLAWYAEPGLFWRSQENVRWVQASLRLLQAFADHGGHRAVIAGSCAEYAWEARTVCRELETPCRPATLYGASKHRLHLIAERYLEQRGMSLAWGRVFFVFGPGEHPARLGGSVARAVVLGEQAPCSRGEQVRDFMYSEDVAAAFVALLRSDVEGPVNIASGAPVRVCDLVEALGAAAGRPELIQLGMRPGQPGEPDELIADAGRLRNEVGWTPPSTLAARAADTIAWWRKELSPVGAGRA